MNQPATKTYSFTVTPETTATFPTLLMLLGQQKIEEGDRVEIVVRFVKKADP